MPVIDECTAQKNPYEPGAGEVNVIVVLHGPVQTSPAAPGIVVEKLCGTPASLFVNVTVTLAPDGAVTVDRSNANALAETLIATGPGAAAVGVGGRLVGVGLGVGLGGGLVGVAVAVGGTASVGVAVGLRGGGVGETATPGETAPVGDGDGPSGSAETDVAVGEAPGDVPVAASSSPLQAANDTLARAMVSPRTSRFIGNYYADGHEEDRLGPWVHG